MMMNHNHSTIQNNNLQEAACELIPDLLAFRAEDALNPERAKQYNALRYMKRYNGATELMLIASDKEAISEFVMSGDVKDLDMMDNDAAKDKIYERGKAIWRKKLEYEFDEHMSFIELDPDDDKVVWYSLNTEQYNKSVREAAILRESVHERDINKAFAKYGVFQEFSLPQQLIHYIQFKYLWTREGYDRVNLMHGLSALECRSLLHWVADNDPLVAPFRIYDWRGNNPTDGTIMGKNKAAA